MLIDFDRRHRRRIMLRTEQGRGGAARLPQAVRLREATGWLVDGGVVRVCAQPEPLLEIHAHDEGEMVRIAWHLGNRHLPVQLLGDRIRIRADHVIREMVEGWVATSTRSRPRSIRKPAPMPEDTITSWTIALNARTTLP